MDEPATIADALTSAGLPAERLLNCAQDQAVKDRLTANTNDAVARGVFGSPSFFVGDQLYFGKDRLREVEESLAAA